MVRSNPILRIGQRLKISRFLGIYKWTGPPGFPERSGGGSVLGLPFLKGGKKMSNISVLIVLLVLSIGAVATTAPMGQFSAGLMTASAVISLAAFGEAVARKL